MSRPKAEYFQAEHQAGQRLNARNLPTPLVCIRYNVSDTTLRRWADNPAVGFPQPFQVSPGGLNFWSEAELDRFDQLRAAQPHVRRKPQGRRATPDALTAASTGGDNAATAAKAGQDLPHQQKRIGRPTR
jgi:hypothetical protein